LEITFKLLVALAGAKINSVYGLTLDPQCDDFDYQYNKYFQ
jgi:hypothetical protein